MTTNLPVRAKFTLNDSKRRASLIDEIRSETRSRLSTGKALSDRK